MDYELRVTGDEEADRLLSHSPLAVLVGMLLDQQVPMETAFAGPHKLAERLGGLEAEHIAAMDAEEFAAVCAQRPAVHRFPGAMARRVQALCRAVVEEYGGHAEAVWTEGDPDGPEVLRRLRGLPGFGEQKARVFVALLGKQLGVRPDGWREAAGPYGEEGSRRSVADVVDAATLAEVRAAKRRAKTSGR